MSWRYDKITKHINKYDTILELGCGTFQHQPKSKLYSFIKGHSSLINYFGIDIQLSKELEEKDNFVKCNILEFESYHQYDKILMVEVIEHIEFKHWENLLEKYAKYLYKDGKIIITTPYKQNRFNHWTYIINRNLLDDYPHTVYNIEKRDFKIIVDRIPNLEIEKQYITKSSIYFKRIKNEPFIKAVLRYIKRIFFRYPYYTIFTLFLRRKMLITIIRRI